MFRRARKERNFVIKILEKLKHFDTFSFNKYMNNQHRGHPGYSYPKKVEMKGK